MRKGIQENILPGADEAIFETAKESLSSIKAVIFDMDGVIIDSEPFWREAETIVFKKVGIQLTESMCLETMGLRVDEIVNYWYRKQPSDDFAVGDLEEKIVNSVIERILLKGKAKEGTNEAIAYFKNL